MFDLIYRIILILSLVISISLQGGNTNITISNEGIAKKLLVEKALQQIYGYAPKYSRLVIQVEGKNSEISQWMQQNIIDSCIVKKYSVFIKSEHSIDSSLSVDISNPDITFEYHSLGKKLLLFNKRYKRIGNSNFHISIKAITGKILSSQNFSSNFNDTLSNVNKIENEKLSFTKGKRNESQFGKRIIEPLLITASTITMVYLFYSLRSSK